MSQENNQLYIEFACDLCNSKESIEVPHCREYTNGQVLSICKKCGLIYAPKRRSAKAIADAWSNELFGDPKVLTHSSYSAKNPHVKARQTYVADFIDTHVGLKEKKLIDIGAGEGQFLEIAQGYGSNVFGVEPSVKNCAQLQEKKIPSFNGTAEEYLESTSSKAGSEKADVVTMMWTLECSQTPQNLLKTAYQTLKENGYVVIATGSRILVPFKKPLHKFLSSNPVDTHPINFSFNTMKGMLAKTGFKIIQVNPYVENDLLCVLAQKCWQHQEISWQGDDYLKVADFFERWHKDSLYYREC